MTLKQLTAYKVLLVGCGSPTPAVVNVLSQKWAKGWVVHHCLFSRSAPSQAFMLSHSFFLSSNPPSRFPPSPTLSLFVLYSPHCFSSYSIPISPSFLSPFLALTIYFSPHPALFSPSLAPSYPTLLLIPLLHCLFFFLSFSLHPLPVGYRWSCCISVGLIGYDRGGKRLWNGSWMPEP